MKRAILNIITFFLIAVLCACGNNEAELNEVKSYLTNNSWYRYVGGNYGMEEVNDFSLDGSYICYTSDTITGTTASEGTYTIDTKNDCIDIRLESDSSFTYTYSLYSEGLKLFNSNAKEFTAISK